MSYVKPRQLSPDQAALLQDVEVAISGAAISRRGTVTLGAAFGATSIRALGFFKTSTLERPVAISNNTVYYWTGAAWVTAAQTVSTSSTVNFAQGVDFLYVTDGIDLFKWTGAAWTTLSTAGSNATAPRGASLLTWFTNRLIVGGSGIKNEAATIVPDAIYLSNFLDASVWDDVAHAGAATKDGAQIRIGGGDGAANVALIPWQNYNLAVFKRHSVYVVVCDPTLAIADMPVQLVHGTVGCVAPRTAVQVGADIFFLSDDGVRSLQAVAASDQQHEAGVPLSFPVQDIINRVNWQYANTSCAIFWRNLYLIALPLDTSQTPNYILTYNILTEKWNGIWTNLPANCFAVREDNTISKLLIGLASTNKVVEYLDYIHDSDAVNSTFQDWNLAYVLPRIKTRSMYFNDPVSPKLGIGTEMEWFNSAGRGIVTLVLDERQYTALQFRLGTPGITLPFTLNATLPLNGITRRSHDLIRYGEFRELQYDITTRDAGRKEIRQITSNAFVKPSVIGFSAENTPIEEGPISCTCTSSATLTTSLVPPYTETVPFTTPGTTTYTLPDACIITIDATVVVDHSAVLSVFGGPTGIEYTLFSPTQVDTTFTQTPAVQVLDGWLLNIAWAPTDPADPSPSIEVHIHGCLPNVGT